MRVKLFYERTSKTTERGHVYVDVEEGITIRELYETANKLDFSEYLPTSREDDNVKWEFNYLPERNSA